MEKKQAAELRMPSSAHLADEQIIDLYWDRDEKAIRETDRKYGRYLYVVAYNIVHDRLDCEECLNDTYLGTWNNIPPQRPSIFQVFLSRIMRNVAVDKFRAKNASRRVPSEMTISLEEIGDSLADTHQFEEEIAVRALGRALNDYVRSLNDREQFIFVCRYYYADKIAAIAQMLRVGEATVYRELSAIREGLREYLEKEGFAYE